MLIVTNSCSSRLKEDCFSGVIEGHSSRHNDGCPPAVNVSCSQELIKVAPQRLMKVVPQELMKVLSQ